MTRVKRSLLNILLRTNDSWPPRRRPYFALNTKIACYACLLTIFFFFFYYIPAYIGDEDNVEVRIIAGATVAVVVVLVVVIIMTVLFLRRYVVSVITAL